MDASISLYDFLDYRVYLNEYIGSRRKSHPGLSVRGIAYKIGCNPGFFSRVLKGTRNLSADHVLKLGEVLKLTSRERKYFELLVLCNQAKKQAEKDHWFEQLESLRKLRITQVSSRQYAIYSHWYYMVLRELLHFYRISDDAEETLRQLGRMVEPPLSVSEVRGALQVLTELGMVRQGSGGVYELNEQFITTGSDVPGVVVNRYLMEFMDVARRAVDRFARSERTMSALTFSVSRAGYEKIRQRLDDCRKEILAIVGGDDLSRIDRVYNLNLHLFPVSKPYKGGTP